MTIYKSLHADVAISDLTVTEQLLAGLEGREDDTVFVDGPTGREVTGAALADAIRRLAGGLTAAGLGGATVALMAPNSPEYCIVFHGVAFAGGTITTLNPTYTASEVQHQLIDSKATVLVTVPESLATVIEAAEGTAVARIVTIGDAAGAEPLEALMGPPQAAQTPVDVDEHVVALPYSSGTTGRPKGVMLTHRNFVVNTDQTLATVEIGPGDATPVFLPFFHIYGLMCLMHLAVIAGGKIVTMPRFDLAEFLRLIEEHRARALWVVPPVAIALAKHPLVAEFDLSSVEYVNSAAAPLGAETAEALAARLGCVVAQGYGMTELSPVVAISRTDAHRSGASGRLVPNTELRIVDPETGADRAPGEEGEVIVRGPQVMKGYLGNPEATAGTIDADGWLHTGDIGVMDADGYLHIRDRVKELIKVKGFQVAPAELEAVLLELPAVADAAVIGVPDEEAGERPVAFVVAASGAAAEAEPLMAHLDARLSHYKQLSAVHFVDAIPKSASGKILRRVLRAEHAG